MTAESMTDREMIEFAAKAAGISGRWLETSSLMLVHVETESGHWDKTYWNPLTSSGDALNLAVRLGINIDFGANYVIAGGSVQLPTVNNANDPCAAARRAIVLAAAEIGRKMP